MKNLNSTAFKRGKPEQAFVKIGNKIIIFYKISNKIKEVALSIKLSI